MSLLKIFTIFLACFSLHGNQVSLEQTLNRIRETICQKKTGAYLSFSEHDIKLACGYTGSLWDQFEMEQILMLRGDNILKNVSFSRTALNGHRPGEKWAARLFSHIPINQEFPYAGLSASLLSTAHRKAVVRFLQFLQLQNSLIITDVPIPRSTRELLFGECCFISIEEAASLKLDAYTVIIFIASGTVKSIAKDFLDRDLPLFFLDCSGLKEELSAWTTDAWTRWIGRGDEIKILYTSALIPYKFEERKQEYIRCLEILSNYGYLDRTYVIESGPYTPLSFFESHAPHVFYANTNDFSLINKGVNEVRASLAAFDYFGFQDEDMLIKLTGRYAFNNDRFLCLVASHPEVDAFASRTSMDKITTGCFAMRSKYYKRMLKEIDLEVMEADAIDIERLAEIFLQKMAAEGAKVMYLDKIGITANVANVEMQQW